MDENSATQKIERLVECALEQFLERAPVPPSPERDERIARVFESLQARLKPGQQVRDAWTVEEIAGEFWKQGLLPNGLMVSEALELLVAALERELPKEIFAEFGREQACKLIEHIVRQAKR